MVRILEETRCFFDRQVPAHRQQQVIEANDAVDIGPADPDGPKIEIDIKYSAFNEPNMPLGELRTRSKCTSSGRKSSNTSGTKAGKNVKS